MALVLDLTASPTGLTHGTIASWLYASVVNLGFASTARAYDHWPVAFEAPQVSQQSHGATENSVCIALVAGLGTLSGAEAHP
jgi:hypothetical protein